MCGDEVVSPHAAQYCWSPAGMAASMLSRYWQSNDATFTDTAPTPDPTRVAYAVSNVTTCWLLMVNAKLVSEKPTVSGAAPAQQHTWCVRTFGRSRRNTYCQALQAPHADTHME